MDFGIPLKLSDGTVLGSVIGGQVLPEHPDEEKFRGVARELGINEDEYIEALGKVTVRTEAEINAAANLLGAVLNNFINSEYNSKYNGQLITKLTGGVKSCEEYVRDIKENTKQGYKMMAYRESRIFLHLMHLLRLQEPVRREKAFQL